MLLATLRRRGVEMKARNKFHRSLTKRKLGNLWHFISAPFIVLKLNETSSWFIRRTAHSSQGGLTIRVWCANQIFVKWDEVRTLFLYWKIQSSKINMKSRYMYVSVWGKYTHFVLALMLRHACIIRYSVILPKLNTDFYGTFVSERILFDTRALLRNPKKCISGCMISIAFHSTIKIQYEFNFSCLRVCPTYV